MSNKTLDNKSAALARVAPKLAMNENAEYKVVGVSFRMDNFEELKQLLGKADGQEAIVSVVLRHEPENLESESRNAVAVYSSGFQLGHVPDVAAPIFAELLKKSSGLARAQARVYFGKNGPNSLRLRIELPPRFENEEVRSSDLLWLKGDGNFSFPMRTSKYPIHWYSILKSKNSAREIDIGETFIGEDGVLTIGEFGRSPYFDCDYGRIAKPRIAHEHIVNSYVGAIGGKAGLNTN